MDAARYTGEEGDRPADREIDRWQGGVVMESVRRRMCEGGCLC